jgi:hypothetical protein
MAMYFTDNYLITDNELDVIKFDPCAEDRCIRCGEFSNWSEKDLCDDCILLFDYQD